MRQARIQGTRNQLSKLKRGKSTSAERKFSELLKDNHIPFRAKVRVGEREVDFLVGMYAIEIDGHKQDVRKNEMLVSLGYTPLHLKNWEVDETLTAWLINLI